MARDFKVGMIFSADTKQAQSNLDKLSKSLGISKTQMLAVGAAATAMATATVIGLSKAVKLAAEQERQQNLLSSAMQQAGTFTEEAYRHNLKYASSLQQMTIYGDESILGVQKMLTNFGVEGKMLDKLTKATLDLASAKGMDLKSAADLVSKSVGSSTNALTRYGIEVDGAVGSTERMQMVIDNITKLFGGSAKAEADTYSGKVQQLHNALGDLGENIGLIFIPVLTEMTKDIIPVITSLSAWIKTNNSLANVFKDNYNALKKLITGIINYNDKISKIINQHQHLKDAVNSSKQAFLSLLNPVNSIKKIFGKTKTEMEGVDKQAKSLHKNMSKGANDQTKTVQASWNDQIAIARQSLNDNFIYTQEYGDMEKDYKLGLFDYSVSLINDLGAFEDEKRAEKFEKEAEQTARLKALYTNLDSAMSSSFSSSIKGMIDNGWNFKKVMSTIGIGIRDAFIDTASKMGAEWVLQHGLMSAATLVWKGIEIAAAAAVAAAKYAASHAWSLVGAIAGAAALFIAIKDMANWATGTRGFEGGSALVGEHGPEIINLPVGSNVLNATETRGALNHSSNGQTGANININFSNNNFLGTPDEIADVVSSKIYSDLQLTANA